MSQQLISSFNKLKDTKANPQSTPQELFDAFKEMMDELDTIESNQLNLNIDENNISTKKYFMDHVLESRLFGTWLFENFQKISNFKQDITNNCIDAIARYDGAPSQLGRNNESFVFWLRMYASLYGFDDITDDVYSKITSSELLDAETAKIFIELETNKYETTIFFPDVGANESQPHYPVKEKNPFFDAILNQQPFNPAAKQSFTQPETETTTHNSVCEMLNNIADTLYPETAITVLSSIVECIGNCFSQAAVCISGLFGCKSQSDDADESLIADNTKSTGPEQQPGR